ncbi:MAG: hypothetical protein ACRDON_10800 [Gaiellaceae bacterium]
MGKLKSGLVTVALVLCVAGAMPGLVFAVNGVVRSPAEIGTVVLLALAGAAAVAYVATGLVNVVVWHGGRIAARRWPRRAAVGVASAAAAATALLLAAQIG